MELIKPPAPARDIYYKAGAILPFQSLPWIQFGPRESTREAPGASHPKPPPGPSQPFRHGDPHGDPTGDGHEAQVAPGGAALTAPSAESLGAKPRIALFHLFLGSFFLALTKISGRQGEIRQQLITLCPGSTHSGHLRLQIE